MLNLLEGSNPSLSATPDESRESDLMNWTLEVVVVTGFLASPHAGASTVEAVERTGVAAVQIVLEALGIDAETRTGEEQ